MLLGRWWRECQHLCSQSFRFPLSFFSFTATLSGLSFFALQLSAPKHWSSSSPLSSESSSTRTSVVLLLLFKVNFSRTFGFPRIQDSISWKYFHIFLSAAVAIFYSVILREASGLSELQLHCSPITFTSVETLFNSLAILLNMSFLVALPFPNSSCC